MTNQGFDDFDSFRTIEWRRFIYVHVYVYLSMSSVLLGISFYWKTEDLVMFRLRRMPAVQTENRGG